MPGHEKLKKQEKKLRKKEPEGSFRNGIFRQFATRTSEAVGSSWAFLAALAVVALWAITGPFFDFSETWQLVINTGTTIITFLVVFLIQNTQNRDMKVVHLKLDELIRGGKGPRNRFVDLEELSDEELDDLFHEFQRIHQKQKRA